MMNEWTDRLPADQAAEIWERRVEEEVRRRVGAAERELRAALERDRILPTGFYEAMGHFLTLRERLFPELPADPAWKILVTLARAPEGGPKTSITGIAHGADVPMATAIRYIAAMELQGVIERVPHPHDRRQVLIRLTEDGRRRLDTIAERWAVRLFWLSVVPMTLLLYVCRSLAGV